jgi:hypothetical protein
LARVQLADSLSSSDVAGTPPPATGLKAPRGPRTLRATALYFGLALAYCWPVLVAFGRALPSDSGDPGLNTWILWWSSHAVPLTAHWWNAPMFFPLQGALAFSETLLGVAPVSLPMLFAGLPPVGVYDIVFLISIPATAIAGYLLAHRLTGREDAALLAGLAFGFNPYRGGQMSHLQLLIACWMPLTLLALHNYLDRRHGRYLVYAGVCWLFNALTSGYLLLFFAVLVVIWIAWFVRSWRDFAAISATFLLASLPLIPLLSDYYRYQSAIGLTRGINEIEFFSADLSAIWATSGLLSFSRLWTREAAPEAALYPGAIVIGLAVAAAIVLWRRLPSPRQWRFRWVLFMTSALAALLALTSLVTGGQQLQIAGLTISFTRPFKVLTTALWLVLFAIAIDRRLVDGWRRRSVFLFYTVAAIVMLVFAMGPVGHVFGVKMIYAPPYYWLLEMPGAASVRVPARFGLLFVLCLTQAAAIGFSRLTPGGARRGLLAALAVLILVEGWVVRMPTGSAPAAVDLSSVDPRSVLIELPIVDEYSSTAALLRQTRHGRPIANGYSGYLLPHQAIFEAGLREHDETVLTAFQSLAPVAVLVTHDRGDTAQSTAFLDDFQDAKRTALLPAGALYQLPARSHTNERPADPVLSIERIAGSGPDVQTSVLVDGNPMTLWETERDQTPGDQIVITLARPSTISGIELDLGPFPAAYPRRLRVSAGAVESVAQVWEGKTAGLALLGALKDGINVPLRIDLPSPVPGQQIVLALVDAQRAISWSVSEVRVFGR